MQYRRLIAPAWTTHLQPRVREGLFTDEQVAQHNIAGYNVYFLPNGISNYEPGTIADGTLIDTWDYVFVDMDLKDGVYSGKDAFLETLGASNIPPTRIVDSGNGIHVYWRIVGLDANSYLRFQRRIARLLHTDEATTNIFQLMRLPGTMNTKNQGRPVLCEVLGEWELAYTAEDFNKLLPSITLADEQACKQHYDKTYNLVESTAISDEIPPKFGKLLRSNAEAKGLWADSTNDRSRNDYRLGHLMYANGFTRAEALSVLAQSAKALQRAPKHRVSYAENIVNKIWTFEETEDKSALPLAASVKDILQRSGDKITGTRFPCWKWIDNTVAGFRLGHVMGLVAGSGVGKTAMALNIFKGFVQFNPEYDHFFVPLEQVDREIALRWQTMCGEDTRLHDKVHIISNYDENGSFRDLSLEDIKTEIQAFKERTGRKVGCVVVDHIGVLCNNNKLGQDEGVKHIAKAMKGFAVELDVFLIMQSQTSREKAGIGDLELNKDSAFGTSVFENFCDWLVCLWQPLKRMHAEPGCPTVTAFKLAKIRHKKANKDALKEDACYFMSFDSETELMKPLTQDEKTSFNYFLTKATNARKLDRKTELVRYQSVPVAGEVTNVTTANGDRFHTRH